MLIRPVRLRAAVVVLACATSLPVLAHYPWLMPQSASVEPGDPVTARVQFGHGPDEVRELERDRVDEIVAISPDGQRLVLTPGDDGGFVSPPLTQAGITLLAGRQRVDFYTQTPYGWVQDSRDNQPDALRCVRVYNGFKTLVRVGSAAAGNPAVSEAVDEAVGEAVGDTLEILLVDASARAVAGQSMPVQVLFRGQPFVGRVTAQSLVAGAGDQPQELTTDAAGLVNVTPGRAGPLLLSAEAEEPYADPAVCDNESFHATLVIPVAG